MNSPTQFRRLKRHCTDGIEGCVSRRRNTRSGATITILRNDQAGIASDQPWTVRCETHGVEETAASSHEANRMQAGPGGWCAKCLEAETGQVTR